MVRRPVDLRADPPIIAYALDPHNPNEQIELKIPGGLYKLLRNRIGLDSKLKEMRLIPDVIKRPWRVYEEIREGWAEEYGSEKGMCYIGKPNVHIIEGQNIVGITDDDYLFVFINPRKEIFEWRLETVKMVEEFESRFGSLVWKRQ